ncbi:MAG: GDSL-type esterase/lipase family protein [Eubacteriales bacterium]|nr:GDSL-type esterase/lipase family protein [Eubacteriales bacterium]
MEQKKRRPTRQQRRNGLIINILTLIVLVLLVFEGKSLISLFSKQDIHERILAEEQEVFASANLLPTETETEEPTEDTSSAADTSSEPTTEQTSAPEDVESGRETGIPEGGSQYMDVVVPQQALAVDDSYFEDAVFIGDSRMEGFRNLSGITKGSFVTAVGMELENFYTDAQIATAKGNVLVMDALKDINFSKVYMMLGTNELGAYDMDAVKESYRNVLADIKTRSSSTDPTVYVYSVVYVEEALVTTGDYVNNANVDAVNLKILEMCQEEGYHYINLNEILSDGSHSLIPGASQDGIHLEQQYCQEWLDYTKTHYIPAV